MLFVYVCASATYEHIRIPLSEARGAPVIGAFSAIFISVIMVGVFAADAEALKLAFKLLISNVKAIVAQTKQPEAVVEEPIDVDLTSDL